MIVFLLILVLLLAIYIASIYAEEKRTDRRLEQVMIEQNRLAAKELDIAISDWLKMLELPQLEIEMKRQAAARQLRIVLIEKLLLSQNPD